MLHELESHYCDQLKTNKMKTFNGQSLINGKEGYMIIDGKVFCEKNGWMILKDWKDKLKKERNQNNKS